MFGASPEIEYRQRISYKVVSRFRHLEDDLCLWTRLQVVVFGASPEIDLVVLKQNGLSNEQIKSVKVIKTGELTRAVTLKGLTASAGARAAIEAAGGKIVEEV